MANKRQLKKAINLMCGELFVECVALTHYQKETPKEDIDNVMKSVLLLQNEMLNRVNHPEPGMPAVKYFKKLRSDMAEETTGIVDQLYALV